jgi:prolyl-tRNA editing enzyme YbaK/EbsC (Cys-tRNA(Pro) deacylase)
MTPADLARTIEQRGIDARLITDIGDTPTVPTAAAALGVSVDEILKTLLFYVKGEPWVIISHGVEPVPARVLADHFGVGKRQIKLARPEQVLAETGFPVGGVPPICHRNPNPVIMAQSILDYEIVFGGGGDDHTMLRIPVSELLRLLTPTLLPLK